MPASVAEFENSLNSALR